MDSYSCVPSKGGTVAYFEIFATPRQLFGPQTVTRFQENHDPRTVIWPPSYLAPESISPYTSVMSVQYIDLITYRLLLNLSGSIVAAHYANGPNDSTLFFYLNLFKYYRIYYNVQLCIKPNHFRKTQTIIPQYPNVPNIGLIDLIFCNI